MPGRNWTGHGHHGGCRIEQRMAHTFKYHRRIETGRALSRQNRFQRRHGGPVHTGQDQVAGLRLGPFTGVHEKLRPAHQFRGQLGPVRLKNAHHSQV